MALTKLPKNAFGTGAVDASKIEDGTIQNVEITSGTLTGTQLASTLDLSSNTVTLPCASVTSGQIANATIANNKLSNSTITFRGTSRALGDTFTLNVDVDWQSVQTSGFTAAAGKGYFCNTTSAAFTVTLPASATLGDTIALVDYAGTFATNNLTIGRNGHNIQGVANNSKLSTNRASVVLVYADVTKGWIYSNQHNVASLLAPQFTSATGGTITTSGNFKIHSFTGDGCFVVSDLGNSPTVPGGGPSNVDYLVIAGGGGGAQACGGGGGGAGGYRTSFPSPACNAGSFPITATTYPITVGAGGVAGLGSLPSSPTPTQAATSGNPSIFSTITSSGGGRGGGLLNTVSSGGSGGGGRHFCGLTGGTGNTPPVSPSQGNPGGSGNGGSGAYTESGGGGGGSTGTGGNGASGGPGGPGGSGTANSITGSSVTYAGGGGGGTSGPTGGTAGSGGGGTGGKSGGFPGNPANFVSGTAGTANTGGGGGGGGAYNTNGAAGGKGIVIIRYKFQ